MKRRKTSISGSQIKNALDPRLPGGKTRLYVRCPSVCPSKETPNSDEEEEDDDDDNGDDDDEDYGDVMEENENDDKDDDDKE